MSRWETRKGTMRTARGKGASATYIKIPLDENNPHKAWHITEFKIVSGNTAAGAFDASMGVLTTEEPGLSTWAVPGQFDLADNRQIGWAKDFELDSAASSGNWSLLDPDNLVTEDLYVVLWNRTADPGVINYFVRMKQVNVNLNENLFATVRSKSQDVD